MVSIKQLHYALAIEKTLHFKKATEACNVSQSALSTAINELEKQLSVTIFERNNKQVLVTNSGQMILNKAKKVKLALDELLQTSQTNSPLLVLCINVRRLRVSPSAKKVFLRTTSYLVTK